MANEVVVAFATENEADTAAILDKVAETSGVEQLPDGARPAAFDPVSWALVIGAVAALTAVVIDYFQSRQGGMIVDRSKDPIEIRRDPGVFPNTIVVILTDGTVTIEDVEPNSSAAERIFNAILGLTVGATVDAVKQIAADEGIDATADD